MSTVDQLIDRTLRTYLEPPDFQPATAFLADAYTAGDNAFTLENYTEPEAEDYVTVGGLVEIDSELFLITSYDEFTGTCTAHATEKFETTPANHAAGARVKIAGKFPRKSIYEAISDNIITLSPTLFQVKTVNLSTIGGYVVPLDDALAVDMIEAHEWGVPEEIGGKVVDYSEVAGGRAVKLDRPAGSVWIKYRRRMMAPSAPTDSLSDLGVDQPWERIIMVGACADLFAGRDLPASFPDWVGQMLEAENVRVGTRSGLAGAMMQYHQLLLVAAQEEMRNEYRTTVRRLSVSRR